MWRPFGELLPAAFAGILGGGVAAARGEVVGGGKRGLKCPPPTASAYMQGIAAAREKPANMRVGAEILPRLPNFFADREGMRGLIGQVFPPRPAFWQLFSGLKRDARSARVALSTSTT